MDRLSEIRARCEAAKEEKRKGNALDCACLSWAVVLNDVPYLLAEIERLKTQCDINATSFFDMRDQFKKAEAERDAYRAALQNWHEQEGE